MKSKPLLDDEFS